MALTGVRCLYNCNDAVDVVDPDIERITYLWSEDVTWEGEVAYPQNG
jgi:predicted metal-binding protein